jgi:GDP-L-fucose synthase
VPTNLFGINDNYDLERSHLIAALIRKFHRAKIENKPSVTLWGTGRVLREVLNSDEVADACLFFMNSYSGSEIINIGSGVDYYILDLANIIKDVVQYNGEIEFDKSMPDGMYKKQLDVTRASRFGWNAKNRLVKDLTNTYNDFAANYKKYCNK